MQNFFVTKALNTAEPALASRAIPQVLPKDLQTTVHSFADVLSGQLNEVRLNPYEDKQANDAGKSNPVETEQERQELKSNPKNLKINENRPEDNAMPGANPPIKEKENVQARDDAGALQENEKKVQDAGKKESDDILKTRSSAVKKKNSSEETPSLLKEINILLSMIENLQLDKKQVQEIKTTLFNLKNSDLSSNPRLTDNNKDLKNLLDQLKTLIGLLKENTENKTRTGDKISFRNRKDFVIENKQESKAEPADIGSLKKQLTMLIREIRQHIENKGTGRTVAAPDDFLNENKNVSGQKIFYQASNSEVNETRNLKDNLFNNNNFSFAGKDTGSAKSVFQKTDVQANLRSNAFNEQLNSIVQNAKIVVRDSRNGSFSIRLHPESLGRVNVNLNMEQGVILGKFLVESAEAKEVLLENMYNIRETLQKDGISVGEFQVNVRGENSNPSAFKGDNPVIKENGNRNILKDHEYDLISSYSHDGQIDLII